MRRLIFSLLACTQAVSAEVVQMHPDPNIKSLEHPYILHDKAGWDEVRAKVEKYDWAKQAAKGYIDQAEKWNVPSVSNQKDPKKGDWLFRTQEEWSLMSAGISYQLTGEKKFAEKVRTFLLRLSDPKNGFPVTRRGCNQASVQEGHFFQHIAMAYDMAIPSGVFTDTDRKQIDDTLRLFIGEERDLGSNNISNWCVSWNCGALYCALVIQDLKAADWILNTPGGVLDQLQRGVLDDGWWYECSISYNVWCATEFSQVAIAMRRWGMDLVNAKFPGGYRPNEKPPEKEEYGITKLRWGPVSKEGVSIKRMWDALPPMLDYRSKIFGLNDSTQNDVGGNAMDIGYYLYRDPAYAAIIKRSGSRDLLYGVPELPEDGPDLSRNSAYADNAGVAVLRSQTADRSQREQIQAVLHYGDHGWFHGHFDRTNLLHLSRYGRSFYNPEMVWYGYPNFMYKFYVQTSVSKNMVVVDQKMQEPVESQRLLFHSGKMMQATVVQTNARWSNPPYGGMVYWDQPHKTFAEKSFAEGRSVPVPENPPKYGAVTDYSEPVLQRRLMVVTDDYIVLADYLKAEKEHVFESLFQMKGFQGVEGAKFARHTGQWNPDPVGSAQFVTDCDWYDGEAPVLGRYEFCFGPGADNSGTRADSSEDGVLKFDLRTLWPLKQEIMVGAVPEVHGSRRVKYSVKSGDKVLAEGITGVWVLGSVDVDVPVEGLNSLELLTDQKDKNNLFWANARIVTKDGKEIPITKNSVDKDSSGGPIKIAGIKYEQALPAHVTLDLAGMDAVRFKATFGADYFVGDESQRRKTVAVRSTGKEARFLTVLEPYEDKPVVKSAVAMSPDSLRVELMDGRVQEITLRNFDGDGSGIAVTINEMRDGKVSRSEETLNP
ncbi:MAG TPA: hypothetical protein DET40_16570 [Lentisphaeria bacterium]|nr:MAG: hypothetical protein A2X45_23110 [Lentisphaerae bacterium GWF2_50_93]HCE45156.1 hypothetical protein [Lentisphaeria bacterium]